MTDLYQDKDIRELAETLVTREVRLCVSSLVSTLAEGNRGITEHPSRGPDMPLRVLSEQALDLASPVLDYEEAAIQAGWQWDRPAGEFRLNDTSDGMEDVDTNADGSWERLCGNQGLDPYEREVFEHWAVSQYLAEALIEIGEKVDTDFAGMCVWARTTTGQVIAMDDAMLRVAQLVRQRAHAIREG